MLDRATEKFILQQLRQHRVMTLATVRPDGFPQATIVAFAHDGLKLYVAVDATGQKARNIRRSGKVSAAIGRNRRDWNRITGLSMGAQARVLRKAGDIAAARACLIARFPQMKALGEADDYAGWAFLEIVPIVISVLDYRKEFGHTELVHLSPAKQRR